MRKHKLPFDSQVLLPNLKTKNDLKNNLMNKDFNYKIVYNLKMNNKKVKKRVITEILKLDENNEYGNGMTKQLPTDCIKDNDNISWKTFNFLLESVSFEDTIGHLYIVDIEFDFKNATEREFAYNEIYRPIFERLCESPCERSVFQLLGVKKMLQKLTDQRLKHMQIFKKKTFCLRIWKI